MSISGDRTFRYSNRRTARGYALCAAATGLFSLIYERFSHGVYSDHMVFADLLPLCGGMLVYLLLDRLGWHVGRLTYHLYNSALATLTVGSLFQGILEIYGTTSRLAAVYLWAGLALLLLAAVCAGPGMRRGPIFCLK